jgi:hypothetical protein
MDGSAGLKILPGTGWGTSRRLVEGEPGWTQRSRRAPSTTPLRVAVPLPVPGRIFLRRVVLEGARQTAHWLLP